MKHYLLSAVLFASVMLSTSCDKYDEPEHSILTTTDAEPCKTLQDVKKFNERLMANPPFTRSSVDKRCMIKADMMGAIYGIGLGDSFARFSIFAPYGVAAYASCVFAGALTVGAAYSWKNYNVQCAIVVTAPMMENVYDIVKNHCFQFTRIKNNNFVCTDLRDSLLNTINLPEGYSEIEKIGVAHNAVLRRSTVTGLRPTPLAYTRGGGDGHDFGDNTIEMNNECARILFDNNLYKQSYNSSLTMMNDYIDSTSDFNDYGFLANNPLLTERANDIFKQFMIAFEAVPASTSHITSIVNNYIRIIETNNELSRAERIQLYTGLIVAVYSCEFWKNKLKPALSF